jgi:predicted RNA-binding Zn-ribbon protein involved in translation (DUF1610 family)
MWVVLQSVALVDTVAAAEEGDEEACVLKDINVHEVAAVVVLEVQEGAEADLLRPLVVPPEVQGGTVSSNGTQTRVAVAVSERGTVDEMGHRALSRDGWGSEHREDERQLLAKEFVDAKLPNAFVDCSGCLRLVEGFRAETFGCGGCGSYFIERLAKCLRAAN